MKENRKKVLYGIMPLGLWLLPAIAWSSTNVCEINVDTISIGHQYETIWVCQLNPAVYCATLQPSPLVPPSEDHNDFLSVALTALASSKKLRVEFPESSADCWSSSWLRTDFTAFGLMKDL